MSHHAQHHPRRRLRKPVDLVGTIAAWVYGLGIAATVACLGLMACQEHVGKAPHLPSGISLPDLTQE
ncbi:hypothetical protein ABT104_27170 [Streptomyces mobaraensis]|uniref:Uncharacterized protein n=1 Tax=Streptomyces cinnamoneus TaxID=53446 RepID=A0A918TA53_STRCJ|nr:hypothetical protein [Streptomyces cinnamoneus]GHC37916.1 hypothetical protein GCM10010507_09330 [Streptomyces cinnamoneus]